MTRNLKSLGVALMSALALGAVMVSPALASPAVFTANVPAGVTAKIHGGQVGVNTITFTGLALTCTKVTATGQAVTAGASSTEITVTPEFETCHVVVAGLTKIATVTHNGCNFKLNATKNTSGKPFSADFTVECPSKPIEIHIYNAAASEATVLCTFDLGHQTITDQIELTNISGSPDDVLAHLNVPLTVHNTLPSAVCGQATNEPATYHGTLTLQATDGLSNFVNLTVS